MTNNLDSGLNAKKKSGLFGRPMIWRESTNEIDQCASFCRNGKGFNVFNVNEIFYPNGNSPAGSISQGPETPIILPSSMSDLSSESSDSSKQRQCKISAYIGISPSYPHNEN